MVDMKDITDFLLDTIDVPYTDALLKKRNPEFEKVIKECDLLIARVPSIIAYRAVELARKYNKPYMTEAMGCGWDGYWNHSLAGKLIAPYTFFKMKQSVKYADFATYVTEEFLQNRYPTRCKSLAASNVMIECDENILPQRLQKIEKINRREVSLMTSAGIDVKAKGHRYVIEAIPLLKRKGINVTYFLAGRGEGKYLKKLADKYNIRENVVFLGRCTREQVFEYLDKIDIYIQPSLQEGLPRSVIEAMSRGCPCLGARTAGIPELLAPECVFERKSSKAVAAAVERLCNSDIKEYAMRNFEKSKKHMNDVLEYKRKEYYDYIKQEISDR